jgi:hypothetical protein
MPRTQGSETINKKINWKVSYMDGTADIYKDLTELCEDHNIHRTSVYKIYTGKSKPLRQRHIKNIEKVYSNVPSNIS